METSLVIPQRTGNRTSKWSGNSTPAHTFREKETGMLERFLHLHAYCSTVYKIQNQPRFLLKMMNKWEKCGRYTQWNMIQL
jgi:hypothetical protein